VSRPTRVCLTHKISQTRLQILLDRYRTDILKCKNYVMESCVREPGAGSIAVFGPLCRAAWAERDGPAAAHRSSEAPPATGSGNRSPTDPADATTSRCGGVEDGLRDRPIPHSRRARPLRGCPRPDGAAYKSRTAFLAGRRMGSRGRPPASFAGRARAANPRRAQTRTRNPGAGHLRPSRPTVGSSPGCRPLFRHRRRRGQKKRKRGTRCSVRHKAGVRCRSHRHGGNDYNAATPTQPCLEPDRQP
jgi:hypothetical protein